MYVACESSTSRGSCYAELSRGRLAAEPLNAIQRTRPPPVRGTGGREIPVQSVLPVSSAVLSVQVMPSERVN